MKKPALLTFWLFTGTVGLTSMAASAKEPLRDQASNRSPKILMEAAVLEVSLPDSKTPPLNQRQLFLGSSILWFTNLVSVETNDFGVPKNGFAYTANLGNGFNATLAGLKNARAVEVIQKPRIQTWSGVPAALFVGQSAPYANSEGDYSHPAKLKIDIQLEFTPVIKSDGAIDVEIKSTMHGIAGTTKLHGVSDVPAPIMTQSVISVTVHDGDIVLLGGAIQSRKTQPPRVNDRGALANQPHRLRHTELMVLVRTTVLPAE
jgi:type II secretory pathway component GspD/PulD (secretin)